MAVVVSLINMKGGVGKTTLAAQLALYASSVGIRTLAINLDPQANLSQTLLGQEEYLRFLRSTPSRPTIDDVVRRYLPPSGTRKSPTPVKLRASIVQPPGWQNTAVELVPSRLELAATIKRFSVDPHVLAREIAEFQDTYQLILIDCAPTESILTDTAYHASGYLLVPVKPEYLATIGLPLLANSVQEFKSNNKGHGLEVVGIVINYSGYGPQKNPDVQQSVREIRDHGKRSSWYVFPHEIPYSASWTKAARLGTLISQTPHARPRTRFPFVFFAEEFLSKVGVKRP